MKKILTYSEIVEEFKEYNEKAKSLAEDLEKLFEEMDRNVSNSQFNDSWRSSNSNDTSEDKYIKNKILINQRNDEAEMSYLHRMRFYRPYTKLKEFYDDSGYTNPKFLKVEELTTPSSAEYNAMSDNEKAQLYIDLLKKQAVVSARRANVANREKDSERRDTGGLKAFEKKDIAIIFNGEI